MNLAFRIIRKLILVSLTSATLVSAALWLLVTFAPFLGRSAPITNMPDFVVANLPNGGWIVRSTNQPKSIRWYVYVTPSALSVLQSDTAARSKQSEFRLGSFRVLRGTSFNAIALPYWVPVAAFGMYPAFTLVKLFLRRWKVRRNPNSCTTCGYNLTGNVSGTCPECGININLPPNKEPQNLAQRDDR